MSRVSERDSSQICVKCGQSKSPADDFYARGGRPDTVCKECKKTDQKRRYQSEANYEGTKRLGDILNWLIRDETENVRGAIKRLDALIEEAEQTPPGTYPVRQDR